MTYFVVSKYSSMKEFKKYFKFKASVQDVYNAVVNPEIIEIWTGEKAVMPNEPNSEFEIFDGAISGVNLEFEKDKKLVQVWDFGEQEPASTVTMIFHDEGTKCSVELRHTNIPEEAYKNIVEGWQEDYFGAIQAMFNE